MSFLFRVRTRVKISEIVILISITKHKSIENSYGISNLQRFAVKSSISRPNVFGEAYTKYIVVCTKFEVGNI